MRARERGRKIGIKKILRTKLFRRWNYSDVFEVLHDCLLPLNTAQQADRQRNRWTQRERWTQGQAVEMSHFKTEQMSGVKVQASQRVHHDSSKNNHSQTARSDLKHTTAEIM